MNIEVGNILNNRYRVDKFLGRGGMAEVYKVWDKVRSTHLAMKVLHEDMAQDRVFLRRFQREAQTLSKLQHPNIVRFYGLEQDGRQAFLLLEYVDGHPLRQEIFDLSKPMPSERILEILTPVCSALQYAHNLGFVHCDVKPANIMIEKGGRVLLTDFGITRMTEGSTATMVGAGTPAYMAPEQILGKDPTPRTDVYSLGVVMYELVTGGERPFTGASAKTTGTTGEKVRWEKLNLNAPSPRKHNKMLSPALEAVILRCLARDPDERYATPADLQVALEAAILRKESPQLLKIEEDKVAPVKVKPVSGQKTGRRNPVWIGIGAVLLLMFMVLAGAWLFRDRSSSGTTVVAPVVETVPLGETAVPMATPTTAPTSLPGTEVISVENIDRLGELGRYGPPIINSLIISPDGRYLIGATSHGLVFYDPLSLEEVRRIETAGWVTSTAISPDMKYVVAGMGDQSVRVFTFPEGALYQNLSGHRNSILSMAFTADGKNLVTASTETIQVWSAIDFSLERSIDTIKPIYRMELSPDCNTVAAYTGTGSYRWWDRGASNEFDLWNIHSGKLIQSQQVYSGAVSDLIFTPAGDRVITGDGSGRVDEWRLDPFQHVRTIFQQNDWVSRLAITPDGKRIITSSSTLGYVRIFNYADGSLVKGLGEAGTDELIFNNRDNQIITASSNGYFKVWNASNWHVAMLSTNTNPYFCEWYNPCRIYEDDGLKMVVLEIAKQHISFYSMPDMTLEVSYDFPFDVNNTGHYGISPAARYILFSNYVKGETLLYDIKGGQYIGKAKSDSFYFIKNDTQYFTVDPNAVMFYSSATGELINSVSLDFPNAYAWVNAVSAEYISVYFGELDRGVIISLADYQIIRDGLDCSDAAFINQSTMICHHSSDGSISLVNIDTGAQVLSVRDNNPDYYYKYFSVSPGADLLLIMHAQWDSDPIIEFYDINSGAVIKTITGPEYKDASISFTEDGTRLMLIRGSMIFELGIR